MGEYLGIQRWMVTELGLSGNELLTFAIVFGFSQDGESKFRGSLKYIMGWLNCTKKTAINTLASLCDKGYVVKHEETIGGVKLCRYSVAEELAQGGRCKNYTGGVKFTLGGGVKITPNNIVLENIENNNPPYIPLTEKPTKKKVEYAKGVTLTEDEYIKLQRKYASDTMGIIQFLSKYKQEKTYKNKSDYLSIDRWVANAYFEKKAKDAKMMGHSEQPLTDYYKNLYNEIENGEFFGNHREDADYQ